MRTIVLCAALTGILLGTGACSSKLGGGDDGGGDDDDGPNPPPAWTIDVDMSGLDRFVPLGTATWAVGGTATASDGLTGVDVNGVAATVGADGSFSAEVATAPGLTVVPIVAHDAEDHHRQAHRTLLQARFLPEGSHNRDAAALVLNDAIVASMGEGLAGEAGDVDVAAEIMARDILSQDDRCVTWPVYAEQDPVTVALVLDGADLWLHIQIPNLYVYFEGQCQGLISTIGIAGEMGGTIDVWSELAPEAPLEGACLTSFGHTTPETIVNGWYFGVWGTGGPLQNWIVNLFSGSKSAEAKAQIQSEVGTRADDLLEERLADITVFDRSSSLELLSRPIDMHLCVSGLDRAGDQLIARIGASAVGDGMRAAPGAPQLDGVAPAVGASELLLDGNLVAQLLFAAWRDGGLAKANVQQVELSLIGLLVPELRERYPDADSVDVSIDGELPPIVHATPDGPGDLRVEIGDLMLDLSIGEDRVFRFGVSLTLELDLVPTDGALVPTVVATDATVILLDEILDGPDDALEDAVKLKIGDAAEGLLSGASLALPELPGVGAPTGVTADAGGRFLRVTLQ